MVVTKDVIMVACSQGEKPMPLVIIENLAF